MIGTFVRNSGSAFSIGSDLHFIGAHHFDPRSLLGGLATDADRLQLDKLLALPRR